MIDDRGGKQRLPVAHVSFHDLRQLGFEIAVQCFMKEKPDGSIQEAVKVLNVTRHGKNFPKSHMYELLRVMGLDTETRVWVESKRKHRCLSQREPVYDFRYAAKERTDAEYLQSGRASMEAIMWSSKLGGMEDEMENMRNGGES